MADTVQIVGPVEPEVAYDGFISYSHAADDLLAPRLQSALQRFAKPWWKRRAVRIFRDESSLSANPHLWLSITEALDTSGWFVLLLSPDAAASEWVNQEIAYWVEHRDPKKILPVVTDGEFGWNGDVAGSAAPAALRGVFQEEPRWVDLRGVDTETELDLQNPEFAAAIADIASSIRGVPKDELASEEVRQHRRTVRTAWAAGGLVTVLAIAAIGFGIQATRAAAEAELATLVSRSAALRGEDADVSVLLALEAHRRSPGPETEQAVLNALGSSDLPNRLSSHLPIFDPDPECSFVRASPLGTHEFSMAADGMLISRDALTGVVTEHGASPDPCIGAWMADFERGYAVVQARGLPQMWIGPIGGPWDIEVEFDERTFLLTDSFNLDNRIPVVTLSEDNLTVGLLDAATGDRIGTPVVGGEELISDVASGDGSLWAASFGTRNPSGPDGTTVVIDAFSGEERFRFSSEEPAAAMAFDMAANELVAAIFPRSLMTVDLESGEVISLVDLAVAAPPLDIGIRPDGLVTVVVNSEVLVVDRRVGVSLSVQELRDVLFAWLRPDGRLFTVRAGDEGTGVLDLEGNALVQQTFPIDAFAKTTFNEGLVSTVVLPTGSTVNVIDLATGERSVTELQTPDGERFTPHTVYPDRTGVWAIDFDNVFTRWERGLLVDRVELGGDAVGGTRLGDLYGYVWQDAGGTRQASLIDLGGDSVEVLFTVPIEDASEAHPTLDGGLFVITADGSLLRFDGTGELLSATPTTAVFTDFMAVDPSSGRIAAATDRGVVTIIEPETGDFETLPVLEPIVNVGFGREGQLLALTGADGTVRLWDVERSASAGVAWTGTGASAGSPSWYDPETTSMWVASSGRLLSIPLDPVRWIERACEIVGRDMTQEEWDRYVPGGGEVQSACR